MCQQNLTLHRRRMQGYHALVLEVHQITPRLQRPRMSQPLQVLPFLSDGSVRTYALSSYALHLCPHPVSLAPPIETACQAREQRAVTPACQSPCNQVLGIIKLNAREQRGTLAPLPIVRSETFESSSRHSSSTASHCLRRLVENSTPASQRSTPHILLSHEIGSIRKKRSAA
jgi:hypothetical protein